MAKRTIHPGNVIEGDIVEFTENDFHEKSGCFLPKGTKAKFLEWISSDGLEYAYASVIPIGINTNGWIWTNPDIIAIED